MRGDLRTALDIPSAVLLLRRQRAGMVQTKEQLRFCYLALRDELKHMVAEAEAGKTR